MSSRIDLNKFENDLKTRVLGRTLLFSRETGSTNEWAKELARLGASEGTITISEKQTHGYGRNMRKWISPNGGLWFSLILRPKVRPQEAQKLAFVAGLAMVEVLRELYGLSAKTKWPNDVLVNGRKICGILSEMRTCGNRTDSVILGIGVNANFDLDALPKSIRKTATTLKNELGRSIRPDRLLKALLEKLETLYSLFIKEGSSSILGEWKMHAMFLGKMVKVSDHRNIISGVACDIDQDGALILKLHDGSLRSLIAGSVSVFKSEP